jgi:hypothetical protein
VSVIKLGRPSITVCLWYVFVLGGSNKLMTVLNIGNYPYHRIENGNGDCIKETKTYQRQTVMLGLPSFITDTLLYNVSEFSMAL